MPSRVTKVGALELVGILIGGSLSLVEALTGTPHAADEAVVIATYTLPDIPLADLQNDALPAHPIADDQGLFLGGDSDL
jgi:hypothetical protein